MLREMAKFGILAKPCGEKSGSWQNVPIGARYPPRPAEDGFRINGRNVVPKKSPPSTNTGPGTANAAGRRVSNCVKKLVSTFPLKARLREKLATSQKVTETVFSGVASHGPNGNAASALESP